MKHRIYLLITSLLLALPIFAQEDVQKITVSGRITDSTGEPMVGAVVMLMDAPNNENIGATADLDGYYSITVPKNSILRFNYLGFEEKSIAVDKERTLNVILLEETSKLDEVVVIGYGAQKKETLTGSLSVVSGKELTSIPVADVNSLLSGAMPGVSTVQSSGQPGKGTTSLFIRGSGGLSDAASKPLVLVDGVERDFDSIDANEIEQISILKDASSTAVFGVKGANGVVLVTTKRGDMGKTSIKASTSLSLQQPVRLTRQADSYNYAKFWNTKKSLDGITDPKLYFTKEQVEAYRTGIDPIMYPSVDWNDYMFNDLSLQSKSNVNVSGGNKWCKYFVSIGYLYQNGMLKNLHYLPYDNNYHYDRYNYRSNLDFRLSPSTILKINLGGSIGVTKEPGTKVPWTWTYAQIWTVPFAGPGLVDGVRTVVPSSMLSPLQGEIVRDGLDIFSTGGFSENTEMFMNLDIELNQNLDFITKGLSFSLKGAYDSNYRLNKVHSGGTVEYQEVNYKSYLEDPNKPQTDPYYDKAYVYIPRGSDTALSYKENYAADRNWYLEAKLNYQRSFDNHNVSAMILYNQSCNHYPLKRNGSLANYPYIPRCYVGVVGRVTYDYKSKYLIDLNMGYNGSENFAPGKTRYGFFPSVSAGWVVTGEKFMQNQDVVNFLKLRASWGLVGSDVGSDTRFMYLPATWKDDGSYSFGVNNPNLLPASGIGKLGNEKVSWETASKQNYGIDIKFFQNKLSLSADYFHEHRKDILIVPNSTPDIFAMQMPDMNLGVVNNQGFELNLGYRDNHGAFTYWIDGNFSFARNKIIYMDEISHVEDYMNHTGGSTGRYDGLFKYEGIYQYSDFDVDEYGNYQLKKDLPQPYVKVFPGDAKYADLNNDNIVDNSDKCVSGYARRPEITYGLNFGFNVANVTFSMQWQGAGNVSRMMDVWYRIPFTDCGKRGLWQYFVEDSWTPENQSGHLPRPSDVSMNWNTAMSTLWLKDASYIRLKSVNLSYSLKNALLKKKLGVGSIDFTVSGFNLFTFSPLKYIDPEGETGQYPLMRLFNFGLNINF